MLLRPLALLLLVVSGCEGHRAGAAGGAEPGGHLLGSETPTSQALAAGDRDALEALPWDARIGLERAMAESDPRHAPTIEGGQPQLASRGVSASFAGTAELHVGEHTATLRAVSLGRGGARTELSAVTPTIEGVEVRAERAPGIVEWWRSLASGLEHGVTIAERPAGEGELSLTLSVRGLGTETISDDAIALTEVSGAVVAMYAHLVVTDARGARLPASMHASAGGIEIGVADGDAAYPIVIDPLVVATEATLLGYGAAGPPDRFGASVALSADATYALVGAPDEDVRGSNAGIAFVFARTGATWSSTPVELFASDAAMDDGLGWSVALSADGSRALVGAPNDDRMGSARVFVRSGTMWMEEATLRAPDGAANDSFGWVVALSGDGMRAVIAAPGDDTSLGVDTGSARVFRRTGTSWSEEATLLDPAGAALEGFGRSVAITADGTRVMVGAPSDSVGAASFCGSASVYVLTGAVWAFEATLLAPDRAISDAFGSSLALSADGSRALIGAAGDDGTGFGEAPGSARVFGRTGATWTQEARLGPGVGGDALGTAVALSPDGSRALVGAPGGNAARLFVLSGAMWSLEATLAPSGGGALPRFGSSVALAADGSRALVGAPLFDAILADAGAAQVFTMFATLGTPCTMAGACGSGFCVDGVCCDTACGGGVVDCQACSVAGRIGVCSPLEAISAAATECRPAVDVCDQPEVCSPTSTTCPADALRPSTHECRPTMGRLCDVAERCTGTSTACPADVVIAAGMACRIVAGVCDLEEVCDGSSPACPGDARAPTSTECRPSLGACDPAEACDGASTACPANVIAPMGTVCGVGMGDCATPGACTGASPLCPSSGFRPMGTLCRAAISACDVEDFCDGMSQVCVDRFAPATQSCGGTPSGVCDAQDRCTGTSGDCMPEFLADVECRASAGACDPAESCTGDRVDCPPDAFAPTGTVCRASTESCDPAESCDGSAASCPADVDMCTPGSDTGPRDGGPGADGSASDGGSADGGAPVPAAGCTCRAASRTPVPWLGLAALVLVLMRRR